MLFYWRIAESDIVKTVMSTLSELEFVYEFQIIKLNSCFALGSFSFPLNLNNNSKT